MDGSTLGVGVTLALVVFLLFLAALWILLPFAVFRSKEHLGVIVRELRELNTRMARMEGTGDHGKAPGPGR